MIYMTKVLKTMYVIIRFMCCV